MLKSIFIQIALNVSCTLIYRSCAEVNAPVKVLLKDYIYIYIFRYTKYYISGKTIITHYL